MQYKSPTRTPRQRASPFLVALLALLICGSTSSAAAAGDPLFADDTVLEITLKAPIREITRDRNLQPEYQSGELGYTDAYGNEIWFDIGIRPRGRSRRSRAFCLFPPLRLNFNRKTVAKSLFAHQDKLKLVTHCKPYSRFEQYLLTEYLCCHNDVLFDKNGQ
ncbi:MAG: hypothetical protein O7G86_02535, partial [Gammaproteobacteria bacterium]|nr:hypothetical protein [Gammaproteobacteria bacterium]